MELIISFSRSLGDTYVEEHIREGLFERQGIKAGDLGLTQARCCRRSMVSRSSAVLLRSVRNATLVRSDGFRLTGPAFRSPIDTCIESGLAACSAAVRQPKTLLEVIPATVTTRVSFCVQSNFSSI